MNDFYTEQLVKKQTTAKDVAVKAFLVSLAIVSVLAVFLFPLAILVPIVVIFVVVALMRRMNVEYEYLYVNGDLDIDKIINRSKRKRVFSTPISNMELLAPEGSPELAQYRNGIVADYSSGVPGEKRYVLVVVEKGQVTKMIFEPNDTIIEGIFLLAPRKVIRRMYLLCRPILIIKTAILWCGK